MSKEAQETTLPEPSPPEAGGSVQEADYTIEEGDQEAPQDEQKGLVPVSQASVMTSDVVHPIVQLEEVMQSRALLDDLISEHMKPRVDYAIIPGTSKPSLLKPGAEKACTWFGLTITFPKNLTRHVEDHAGGFFHYTYTCQLMDRRTGKLVAECEGSANTKEKRFAIYKAKKKGEAPKQRNPFDQVNPCQKMAQKRAMVGAVLFGCALSEHFTQDTEDMSPEDLAMSGAGEQEPLALTDEIGRGKYGAQTWAWVCMNDPDYAAWACGRRDDNGMESLGKTGQKLIADELDRLAQAVPEENARKAQDAAADENQDPSAPFSELFAKEVEGVKAEDLDLIAWAHKDLPDDRSTWTEAHYQRALLDVRKHTVAKLWNGARTKKMQQEALRAQKDEPQGEPEEAPPEVPTIPKKLRDQVEEMLARAEKYDMPNMPGWIQAFEAFEAQGDEEEYTNLMEQLRGDLFKYLGTNAGKEARKRAEQDAQEQKSLGV